MEEENSSSSGSSSRKNAAHDGCSRNGKGETAGRLAKAHPGDLVWVRRRNGAWWPGFVISPAEVPAGGPKPPRNGNSVPIKLLGRLDGSIDWFNLERSTRVKAFRCGEYDKFIEKAEAQAARGPKKTWSLGKYVRREDAILHALELEKSCLLSDDPLKAQTNLLIESRTRCGLQKSLCREVGSVEKNHLEGCSESTLKFQHEGNNCTSSTRYGLKKKQKNPIVLDAEDMRTLRDLREIRSSKLAIQKSAIVPCGTDKSQEPAPYKSRSDACTNLVDNQTEVMKNMQTHSTVKRRRSNLERAHESLRKKDRRCSVSRLHEGSRDIASSPCQWGASLHSSVHCYGDEPMHENADSLFASHNILESSVTSSVDASAYTSCSYHRADIKESQIDKSGVSFTTGYVQNGFSDAFTIVNPLKRDAGQKGETNKIGDPPNCIAFQPDGDPCDISDVGSALPLQSCDKFVQSVYLQGHGEENVKDQSPSLKNDGIDENVDRYLHDDLHESKNDKLPENHFSSAKSNDAIPKGLSLPDVTGIDELELASVLEVEYDEPSETIDNCPDSKKDIMVSDFSVNKVPLLEPSEVARFQGTVSSLDDEGLHDVKLDEQSSCRDRAVPLVSLWSTLYKKHIRGYPLEVQVLRSGTSKPLPSRNDHRPVMSSLRQLLKRSKTEVISNGTAHKKKTSHKKRRKSSTADRGDRLWRPHSKNSGASPRKMRRLSSFSTDHRGKGDKKAVQERTNAPSAACVPVRLVYSRLNEALNFPSRSDKTS